MAKTNNFGSPDDTSGRPTDELTIGDCLPRKPVSKLGGEANGFKSKDQLEQTTTMDNAVEEIQQVIDKWSPRHVSKMDLFRQELKDVLKDVAENPEPAQAWVDQEITSPNR